MAKVKTVRLNHTQKVLTVMISGKVVTTEEIGILLGDQIQMYKLSTYMWAIKTKMRGIIKVIKDGRKVAGYQLVNVDELKQYMRRAGIHNTTAEKPVASLQELEATELPKAEEPATMTVTKIIESV